MRFNTVEAQLLHCTVMLIVLISQNTSANYYPFNVRYIYRILFDIRV